MSEAKRAFVVMGNDFPDAVFSNETDAAAYCDAKRKKEEAEFERANGRAFRVYDRRVYWRVYDFPIDGSKP